MCVARIISIFFKQKSYKILQIILINLYKRNFANLCINCITIESHLFKIIMDINMFLCCDCTNEIPKKQE